MTPALAQESEAADSPTDASSGVFSDDIVVTATRRSQNLQDVGITLTAVTGAQIRALGLNSSTDIAKLSANVSLSGSYGGLTSNFTIRGVTQNDFNDHVESVIATYIDDTYISSQQGANFGLFDIERVEVLKGPQGTLFGRNATGGLVHYISRRPTDHFEGYLDSTYGSYNNIRAEMALSGPLMTGLRARLSGFYERHDGYLINDWPENTYVTGDRPQGQILAKGGADLGGLKENVGLRGQIEADLGPKTTLLLSANYANTVAASAPYQLSETTLSIQSPDGTALNTIFAPDAVCQILVNNACAPGLFESSPVRPAPGTDFYGYRDPDGRGLRTSIDYAFDDGSKYGTYAFSGKLTSAVRGINFTSITDYKNFGKDFVFDLTPDPTNAYINLTVSHSDQFSQEVRLDGSTPRLRWLAGVYYLKINNRSTIGFGTLAGGIFDPFFVAKQPRIARLKSSSFSPFGQTEYDITDTLTVIAGLRASFERKRYSFNVLLVPGSADDDPREFQYEGGISLLSYAARSKETLWNWKAQLNYKPNDDVLIYAGVTQGQKAGSFNSGGPADFTDPVSQIPYRPERLISYETGIKTTILDRRLRLNGALYYYDYRNYQAAEWRGLSSIIINADSVNYGIELEVSGTPADNLDISLNGGWKYANIKNVPIAGGIRDVEPTFAPQWTAAGLIRYQIPNEMAGGNVALQSSGSYQSRVWHNLNNFDANYLRGYFLFDARVSWESKTRDLAFAIFARNLFDQRYETVGFDESYATGGNITSPGKPRWFGANVRVGF
jgi:iron complex outermembrane receptor protein